MIPLSGKGMLALQVDVPAPALAPVQSVPNHPSADHVIQLGATASDRLTLITADVDVGALDALLPQLTACGSR